MRLLSPAWIIAAGVLIAHASGAIDTVANVLGPVGTIIGAIDKSATAVVDLRTWLPAKKPPAPKPAPTKAVRK